MLYPFNCFHVGSLRVYTYKEKVTNEISSPAKYHLRVVLDKLKHGVKCWMFVKYYALNTGYLPSFLT